MEITVVVMIPPSVLEVQQAPTDTEDLPNQEDPKRNIEKQKVKSTNLTFMTLIQTLMMMIENTESLSKFFTKVSKPTNLKNYPCILIQLSGKKNSALGS